MKKTIIALFFVTSVAALPSCGGSNEKTTNDSLSATTTTTETTMTTSADIATPGAGYMDLSTNAKIDIEKDPKTGYYRNKSTQKQVDYYYDPASHDTFDYRGRVVNMAIMKDQDGTYKLDETKIKMQGDGDVKMKSADGETKVKLETNGDMKMKNDSEKIKVRDGKIKVKKD